MDIELKDAIAALGNEHKQAFTGLKTQLDDLKTAVDNVQRQTDAIDIRTQKHSVASRPNEDGLKQFADAVLEHKEDFGRHGRVRFDVPTLLGERKSTILSTGITSMEPASSTGIQGAGRFAYRLRSLFRTVPTEFATIGVLRTTAETLNASPQVEGELKSESTMTFSLVQVPVQTIAHFVNFSRQAMDDVQGFSEFIDATLRWGLERKAEQEVLSGDGTGVHLTGLTTNATAFDTSILDASDGWNRIDILGAAAVQLQEAGYTPTFAVVSPRNWFRMVSLRDSTGQYVLNSPRTTMGEQAYGLTILPSDRMVGDAFLVGDASKAVIRQRMQTTVELAFQHADNFTHNVATCLAEERFGLQILRPDAFVTGSLASSPA